MDFQPLLTSYDKFPQIYQALKPKDFEEERDNGSDSWLPFSDQPPAAGHVLGVFTRVKMLLCILLKMCIYSFKFNPASGFLCWTLHLNSNCASSYPSGDFDSTRQVQQAQQCSPHLVLSLIYGCSTASEVRTQKTACMEKPGEPSHNLFHYTQQWEHGW